MSPLFVNQMRNRRLKPDFIDDRRAHFADQAPRLGVGLANKLHGRLVGFLRLFRGVLPKGIVSLKLHARSGKILGQPVVNLVGDDLPFVVAGLEHSPERLPLPLQGILGFPPFRRVAKEAYHAGRPVVDNPAGRDIGIEHASVFSHQGNVR